MIIYYSIFVFFDKFVASLSKIAWAYGEITIFSEGWGIDLKFSETFEDYSSWYWDSKSSYNVGLNFTFEFGNPLISLEIPFSFIKKFWVEISYSY